ncbi:trypsin-like serine protease [Candidatus Dojkabacteria bacterium]|nr:trypsin-like serine protease [Candidatus Dojkabacteria bacterium]
MKRKNIKIIKILGLFLLIYGLVALIFSLTVKLKQEDTAPDESSAIYGGQIANNEYPYAGYLIAYNNDEMASICGTVYISNTTAISAAHCFDDKITAYLGYSLFNFDLDQNFLAQDTVINPLWNGQNVDSDLAVIKLPRDFYEVEEYATVGSPKIGCDFEVLGYGKTENDNERSQLDKLRKKAQFCVEDINSKTFTLKGKDGGICFGDSGSPIFEKGTNKVVGIISSITTTRSQANENPCSIGNRAVAVRIDQNIKFINEVEQGVFTKSNIAQCGESCTENRCAFGLVCDEGYICHGLNGSCKAPAEQYCSTSINLDCEEGATCTLSRCKPVEEVDKFISVLESDLNINSYTSAQKTQEDIYKKISKVIYYPILGILGVIVLVVVVDRIKSSYLNN